MENLEAMKYHNLLIYLWLILAAMSLSSCMYYMKEESVRNNNSDEDEWLIKKSIYRGLAHDDYIVLRLDSEVWHLYNLNLSDDEQTLTAKKERITTAYQNIVDGIKNQKIKGYVKSQKDFIHQVHFFVENYDFDEETEMVSISVNEILKLEIYKHDDETSNRVSRTSIILGSPFLGLAEMFITILMLSLVGALF